MKQIFQQCLRGVLPLLSVVLGGLIFVFPLVVAVHTDNKLFALPYLIMFFALFAYILGIE